LVLVLVLLGVVGVLRADSKTSSCHRFAQLMFRLQLPAGWRGL